MQGLGARPQYMRRRLFRVKVRTHLPWAVPIEGNWDNADPATEEGADSGVDQRPFNRLSWTEMGREFREM